MSEAVLWGKGPEIVRRPWVDLLAALHAKASATREKLRLTGAARRVREYAVCALAQGSGRPIEPQQISAALDLPLSQTCEILRDLEKRLFFLVLDGDGWVSWAFPVTSVRTPHRVHLNTGETTWGA